MKVKFTNPNNKKFGITEHIENGTGRTLIALGECEEVVMPARGSKGNGWLEARLEQSRLATAPGPHDTVPSAPDGIEWGIKQAGKKVLVLKRVDGNLFFLDGPPADCPASTRQRFLDACAANPEANAAALEIARQQQDEQDRKDKSLGNRTIMSAIFGSGKPAVDAPKNEAPKVVVKYIKSVDGRTEGNISYVLQSVADELVRRGVVEVIKK